MTKKHRREFLKNSVAASATMLGSGSVVSSESATALPNTQRKPSVPPHRPLNLPGLHAYAEKSIAAGETLHLRTSSTAAYQLRLLRLAGQVDGLADDVLVHEFPESQPFAQPIHPGSYIHVDAGLAPDDPLDAISIEAWVRPWREGAGQGIVTQYDHDNACGVGMFLGAKGTIESYFGDGGRYDKSRAVVGPTLAMREWSHVVATWDGATATLWVNGNRVASRSLSRLVRPGAAPMRLAGYGEDGVASGFLDGDLAMPAIYGRALAAEDVAARFKAQALSPPPVANLLACWPLMEENGNKVVDVSQYARTGQIVNHATWMIGGPGFDAAKVGRFDSDYDPNLDTKRGHGLRFASDDLFDCRWHVTHEFTLPADIKSGIYVARYEYEDDGPHEYHVTFIVRSPTSKTKAPLLVLCSTNTWMAYNAAPFPIPTRGRHFINTSGLKSCVEGAPAYSMYRNHRANLPTYYMGLNVPWPNSGPRVLYSTPAVGYSHLMRGELFAHRWLDGHYGDHTGYDYDVVTDFDLHRDPDLLEGYQALVINGHSEYWSGEAMDAVDGYLRDGGKVVALTGNTMLWRVSFDPAGSVMECRKLDLGPGTGGRPGCSVGELYHSHDKQRGCLTQHCGHSPCDVLGLIGIGWSPHTGVYHRAEDEHFLFHEPEEVGLQQGDTFGYADSSEYPKAIYHEWDVRLSTIRKMTHSVPPGAILPEEDPDGMVTLARGIIEPGGPGIFDYYLQRSELVDGVCAEMIYWKRPQGGEVFHAGSIPSGWTLSVDTRMRTLLRNVLHHFGIQPRE